MKMLSHKNAIKNEYFGVARIEESNRIKSKSKEVFLVESTKIEIEKFWFQIIDKNRNRIYFLIIESESNNFGIDPALILTSQCTVHPVHIFCNFELGTLQKAERMKKYEKATPHEFTWTPILWAMKLLQKAKQEGKIQVRTCSVAVLPILAILEKFSIYI